MSFQLIYFILLLSSVSSILSRHVPRYMDLEEDDQQLYRAAYETPSYDQQDYEEDDDMSLGKLDLVKDGLWALKAKIKELKAFDKALAAHLLTTKLKVKDLLKNHLTPIKKHHHEKPTYGYQAPSYQVPAYPQYEQPQQYATQPQQYAQAAPVVAAFAPAPAAAYAHDPYYGH